MKISIVGTGYVGLVSGVCLAAKGHDVVCVDNNADKVNAINNGIPPIHEDGLNDLLAQHIGKRLVATADLTSAVRDSEITFIAVGTPFDGRHIDLRYVEEVSRQIGAALKIKDGYHVVVVKSTVVPGTTDDLVRRTVESASGKAVPSAIGIGMNPEFLTEGRAVADFMQPDRIVIGGIDDRSRDVLANVYRVFENVEVIHTNNKTAEMIKYASNSVLATMISFSNEIASLCSALGGVDVVDVMKGVHASLYFTSRNAGSDPVRAGITSFLEAGCGFGGSCLPKDVKALAAQGQDCGLPMQMLNSVLAVNQAQPDRVIALIRKHYESLSNLNVAILGLAFKPDTDDVRESPAFPIVRQLHGHGASITAYDPIAMENARAMLADVPVKYAESMPEAVHRADVIVLVTAWEEFLSLPRLLNDGDSEPLIVDGRRILKKHEFARYEGIGN